jgi:hypothetical protein
MVKFTDGTVRSFSSPEWQVDPVPRRIPQLAEVPALPVGPPVSLLAKVKINTAGEVVDVISTDREHMEVLPWVRDRMRHKWTFYPALLDGKPIESELPVLFLIHAPGMMKFTETEPLYSPVTLIQFFRSQDLFPNTATIDRWTVTYGFLQEGSTVE